MVDQNRLAVAAVGIVLVAGIVGAAYVSGVADPILGGGGGAETPTPTPTPAATTADGGDRPAASGGTNGGGGTGDEVTRTPPAYDFQFQIVNTASCGNTCRDVTVKLTNEGRKTATGVSAKSRIYAGGDQIWKGTEHIGTVEPGESVTRTKRVKLSIFDAAKVQRNGGYVTIKTTVTWDGGSETFSQRVKAT